MSWFGEFYEWIVTQAPRFNDVVDEGLALAKFRHDRLPQWMEPRSGQMNGTEI